MEPYRRPTVQVVTVAELGGFVTFLLDQISYLNAEHRATYVSGYQDGVTDYETLYTDKDDEDPELADDALAH